MAVRPEDSIRDSLARRANGHSGRPGEKADERRDDGARHPVALTRVVWTASRVEQDREYNRQDRAEG